MQILIFSNSSKTSSFVKAIPCIPQISTDCFNKTRSSQPHLLFLPVTVPNSLPICPSFSPIELSALVSASSQIALFTGSKSIVCAIAIESDAILSQYLKENC